MLIYFEVKNVAKDHMMLYLSIKTRNQIFLSIRNFCSGTQYLSKNPKIILILIIDRL